MEELMEKYPLVVVYYKNRDAMLHFFDDEKTAIAFRKSVNTSVNAKAIYKGKQPYCRGIEYIGWDKYKNKYIRGRG